MRCKISVEEVRKGKVKKVMRRGRTLDQVGARLSYYKTAEQQTGFSLKFYSCPRAAVSKHAAV